MLHFSTEVSCGAYLISIQLEEGSMPRPFLLQYMKKCLSPGRATASENYAYDDDIDMVCRLNVSGKPPAIYCQDDDCGPKTKKCDVEKGEDSKDRRMWQ